MKTRLLLLLIALIPCCTGPLPAAPLTPAQAQMVRDIETKAAQAVADDTAVTTEEATEHKAHLAALKDADDAKKQAAELGDKLAALQTKYDAAVKTIWWYRFRFWLPLTLAFLSLVIYLLTRFTAWGAKTFGPYILGAQTVAADAAKVAALV